MNEQALKIVSDLIDNCKIKGEDAIVLLKAILNEPTNSHISVIPTPAHTGNPNPYSGSITTTVTGNINNDNINATSSKGVEVIYG